MEVYNEQEVSMLNESKQNKRDSDSANNPDKKHRKRRSSLASTRRSITGNLPTDYYPGSDLPSSGSSYTSTASGNENKGLKPNPLNVRMDEIIEQFEAHTSRLNLECSQWKTSLSNLNQQQEQTKLLSECNVSIKPDDLPQELRDLAKAEYIQCDLVDYGVMQSRAEKQFLQTHFNIEKCLQDMRLFRECVNTIRCHNTLAKAANANQHEDASYSPDSDLDPSSSSSRGPRLTDIKSQLEWMMKN